MSSIPVYQPAYDYESRFSWQAITAGERIFAAVLVLCLSPVLAAIWITTWILSGRGPLIAHRRVGQYGSELWVLKFRTMWQERGRHSHPFSIERIDDERGPDLKSPGDSRVPGRFARFCRQHSLDELPQLVHVALGQMSLVGPRPVTPAEIEKIYGSRAAEVLVAKPGLSGLWQVSGRNRLTLSERCHLDLECVRRRSLKLYFSVLMRTIPEVFSGAGAW